MSNKPIKENEFFPAPGGSTGTVNYQTGYGTPSSPAIAQDPSHFESSDKNKVQKGGKGSFDKEVDALFAGGKGKVTPDDIITGIKFELGQMIRRDKHKAKEIVLANLRKDPAYYRDLKMLKSDDATMMNNMNESKHPNDAPAKTKVTPNIEETKKIFAELAQGRDKKYVVNSQIADVMKQMWEQKQKRNTWRGI